MVEGFCIFALLMVLLVIVDIMSRQTIGIGQYSCDTLEKSLITGNQLPASTQIIGISELFFDTKTIQIEYIRRCG
jgi:hypothetical protein